MLLQNELRLPRCWIATSAAPAMRMNYLLDNLPAVQRIEFQKRSSAEVCVKWHFIGTDGTNGHPSSRTVDGTHDAIDSSRRDVICQQQFASRKRRDRPEGGRRFDDVLLQATFLEGSQLPTLRSSATPPPAASVIPMVNVGGCQVPREAMQKKSCLADDDWRAELGLQLAELVETAVSVLGNVTGTMPMLKAEKDSELGWHVLVTVMAAVLEDAGEASKLNVPNAWCARHIGDNSTAVADAQERRTAALAARADGISAKGAVEADQFLFLQQQTRSNMLSEAMVAVIIEVWHSAEVSRRNGNTSDVKKASKNRDAAQHPAQLVRQRYGGGAHKAEVRERFRNCGQPNFLSYACPH
ncbi:hypothetical protein JKP88DRAFT_315826 [Tribonema minus]|uniref:Uncharacterized protein n=1 Tax=Tribonema minus TaxID=303371 RepID=A0A836CFQ2_9STRA|nr:hypothetical protein JKP88DRAFT_315826 [Tribonema minus]